MNGLAAGTLQQIVDAGDDEQLVPVLLQVEEALVRVHHLLQVDVLVNEEGKGILRIILLVDARQLLDAALVLHHDGREDAPGEVAAVGDEVDAGVEAVLQLLQALPYLRHVLVLERLVDAQVIVAPTEVARRARLDARPGAARDGVHHDVVVQHQVLGQGEQSQLDAGGEAAGVGHVQGGAGGAAVQFRQAVDEVVALGLQPVVHGEVDDPQPFRQVVAFDELARVAVGGAEEEAVYLVQRQAVGEAQVGLAIETLVHVGHAVARMAGAVDEDNLCLRVVDEQADKFAGRVAGPADDSYLYHGFNEELRMMNEEICCRAALQRVLVALRRDDHPQYQVEDDAREEGEYGEHSEAYPHDSRVDAEELGQAGAYASHLAVVHGAAEFPWFVHVMMFLWLLINVYTWFVWPSGGVRGGHKRRPCPATSPPVPQMLPGRVGGYAGPFGIFYRRRLTPSRRGGRRSRRAAGLRAP